MFSHLFSPLPAVAEEANKAGAEQGHAGRFRNHIGRYCGRLVVCEHVGSFNPDGIQQEWKSRGDVESL
jgi:hypothetical protein